MPSPDLPPSASVAPTGIVVILATGGTIAGQAPSALDNVGYRAGALPVDALVRAVPALQGLALECETVAAIDSKDMDHATWQRLALRATHHLGRSDVTGVVITHGTDTLEESAWFLHRSLHACKPLVLTAAMRPATSLQADGPQNLLDAVGVARSRGVHGVLVVLAGRVHGAADVQKMHAYRMDAFASPNDGELAFVEEGRLRQVRPWPEPTQPQQARVPWLFNDPAQWPYVAVLTSHAGVDARSVQAWVRAGVSGLVVAGTGNGTIGSAWEHALAEAANQGVVVRRASRCASGSPLGAREGSGGKLPFYPGLNAVKARVELMLELMST